MNEKMQDEEFLTDVEPLLRPEVAFNPQKAYHFLYDKVIEKQQQVLIYEIIVVYLQPKCRNNQLVISYACGLHI